MELALVREYLEPEEVYEKRPPRGRRSALGRERAPDSVRRDLFAVQRGFCPGCGIYLPHYLRFEVDHIVALADDGRTEERNLQLLCCYCNRAKGTKGKDGYRLKMAELRADNAATGVMVDERVAELTGKRLAQYHRGSCRSSGLGCGGATSLKATPRREFCNFLRSTPEAARKEPVPWRFFFLKPGLRARQFGIAPVLIRPPEITRRALSHELAYLGGVLHAKLRLTLQVIELPLQFHGTGPEPVHLGAGRPVGSYHQVENGTGNADGAGGVPVLLHRQADRHLDAGFEPTFGTGGALFVACPDHAGYSCAMLIALLARLAALRRP